MAQSHRNVLETPVSFRNVIVHYRSITLKLSMHQFPAYETGKIALSFKRSSGGTMKVVMVNIIEVLLSKICGSCSVFLEIHTTVPNCLHFFLSFLVFLDATFSYVWWVFSHTAAEIREEIILSEPAAPTPSPAPFSPDKSATSVEVPSAPSPINNQSPEYGGITATTGRLVGFWQINLLEGGFCTWSPIIEPQNMVYWLARYEKPSQARNLFSLYPHMMCSLPGKRSKVWMFYMPEGSRPNISSLVRFAKSKITSGSGIPSW